MSMTKTIVEKSVRDAPSVSTVMFPGQSHISNGMTVSIKCFATRMVGSR